MSLVIFQPRLGLCQSAASSARPLLLCRSYEPPDRQRRTVRVAHPATTLQAHKPQCGPTPRLSGCAPQANETEFAFDPNIAPLLYQEHGRVPQWKEARNQSPVLAPKPQKREYSYCQSPVAGVRLRRPPASKRLKWAKASR